MRKYENVDIIASLGAVMEVNTEYYKSDFKYNIEMIREAAIKPNGDNNHLIWFCRNSGTHCFWERNANIKETSSYNTMQYYGQSRENLLAYAVEINGMTNGKPIGNLYELDIRKQAAKLEKEAFPPAEVTLFLKSGEEKRIPYDEYRDSSIMSLKDKHGDFGHIRFEVADEGILQRSLRMAQTEREKYTPAVFKLKNSNRRQSLHEQLKLNRAIANSCIPKASQPTVLAER